MNLTSIRISVLSMALVAALSLSAQDSQNRTTSDNHGHRVGMSASTNVSATDVGLPLYPGARPQKDDSNDSSALQFGAWKDSSDFRFAVLKMTSDDSVNKVNAFYHKALSKYGRVLDCSNGTPDGNDAMTDDGTLQLTCGQDKPEHGAILLKVGDKHDQHLVTISEEDSHTIFQLVYVKVPR